VNKLETGEIKKKAVVANLN